MSPYALSPQASEDLKRIEEAIAQANPTRAVEFVEGLIAAFQLLATMPKMGRVRPEFVTPHLRSLAHGEYVIFYRPAAQGVDVLRVLHGRRDLGALL